MVVRIPAGPIGSQVRPADEDNWNWLQYREDAFCVHVNVFRQFDGEEECFWN